MLRSVLSSVIALSLFLHNVILECPPPDPIPECFTQKEFDEAALLARDQLTLREATLLASYGFPGFTQTKDDAAYHHFFNQDVGEDTLKSNRIAIFTNAALKHLKKTKNLTKRQLKYCLQNITTAAFCEPTTVSCTPSATSYYRFDGQCNNAQDPMVGARKTPFVRLLNDGFVDGIETPSQTQAAISSRSDSIVANDVKGRNEINIPEANNELTTLAGQIMTHEMMKTKKAQLTADKKFGGFQCCNQNNNTNLTNLIAINDYCWPITVKNDDPCYRGKVKCLNYIKSLKSLNNCKLDSTTMPINFHTPYFDGELIYNPTSLEHLAANGGKFDIGNFKVLQTLLVGYDERSMQLPGLFLFLKFFIKLHNVIFDELKSVKASKPTQELSHLARTITTALYQKTFLDMMVNVLPPKQSSMLLNLGSCYDPSLNPQCSIEFNIALRDFHYFIGEKFSTYDEKLFETANGIRGLKPSPVPLLSIMDNLTFVEKNQCGISHGSMDFVWNIAGVGENVHCKFMSPNSSALGTDLRAFDYQMGMEHGQPSYLDVLKAFNGFNKCDNEFTKNDFVLHDKSTRDFLAQRYGNKLSDITFSLGADFEDKQGQLLGPTNSIVIAEQMKRTICGDRFWFMHAPFFTNTHKQRLLSIPFFDIVCLNINCGGTRVQTEPFLSPGPGNLKRVCLSVEEIVAKLDLRTW